MFARNVKVSLWVADIDDFSKDCNGKEISIYHTYLRWPSIDC
jgi:hypothetical protein